VKHILHIDLDEDNLDLTIRELLMSKLKKPDENQKTLPVKKYFCNNPNCKKEITKSEVAYCLHEENKPRFKGKVYCRDCQANF
jgi:hypothetical protein